MAYVDQTDLEEALSQTTVLQLFDDGTGSVNTAAITRICERASGYVDSYVSKEYSGPWPIVQSPIPEMVREAALAYATAFAFRRHPEYVRTYGENKGASGEFERAEQLCKNIVEALQRIPDLTRQADPSDVLGTFTQGTVTATDGVGSSTFADGFGLF